MMKYYLPSEVFDHKPSDNYELLKFNKKNAYSILKKGEMYQVMIAKNGKMIARWKIALDYYHNFNIYADYGGSGIPEYDKSYDEIWFYAVNNIS